MCSIYATTGKRIAKRWPASSGTCSCLPRESCTRHAPDQTTLKEQCAKPVCKTTSPPCWHSRDSSSKATHAIFSVSVPLHECAWGSKSLQQITKKNIAANTTHLGYLSRNCLIGTPTCLLHGLHGKGGGSIANMTTGDFE